MGQATSSFVSSPTIASVVRLGKIFDIFYVQNMPENHKITIDYGVPNFGGGTVAKRMKQFMDYGSGVIVTPDGWLVTNAHVADDWTEESIMTQDYKDNKGAKYKYVMIPAEPGYLWVTVSKESDVKNNVRKIELLYIAQTMYYDSDYMNYDRDRSLCKIIGTAKLNPAAQLPEMVSEDLTGITFPVSGLGNPFDLPIQDAYVTAMGFPGSGPQTFTTITKGEFMGYEYPDRSYLMHSAFISGGNSGGGLFFNDKLIGINTWDKSDATGRHISIAQPITYFGQAFAYVNLWYGTKNLPEVDPSWISADPSTDAYKNKVYVGFDVVSSVNEKVALKDGYLMAFRKDIKKDQAYDYLDCTTLIQNYRSVQSLLGTGYDVPTIAIFLGIDTQDAQMYADMTEDELKASLNDEQTKFFAIMQKGEFVANYWNIDQYGQVLAAVPAGSDFSVTVLCNGYKETDYTFTSSKKTMQGPYVLKVLPQ
jgi:hypothetical protein